MKLVSYTRDGATRHGYVADEAAGTVAELGDGDLAALVAAGAGTDAGWRPGQANASAGRPG